MKRVALAIVMVTLVVPTSAEPSQEDQVAQELFQKVFGDLADFPADVVEEVLSLPEGERVYRDTNGDGSPDEVWFVDPSRRHPEKYRPVLVRAIDRDGDMDWGGFPDLDSDLYIVDWRADGFVNAAIEYVDQTDNNEVDEMAVYYMGPLQGYFDEPILRVWWSRDDGGDNLLWYDVAYTYDQNLCEFRTHFGGNETFVAFALPLSGDRWIPFWENPFLFYDIDGNGATEEVLRLSGIGPYVDNIRHSFDANNANTFEDPRRFDVSITAWAHGALDRAETGPRSGMTIPLEYTESVTIGGIPTDPFLSHERAREFVADLVWERAMLTWDEIDLNIDRQRFASTYERWEGVITAGTEFFPQVGGPHGGLHNRRYEYVHETGEPFALYFHPVDRRIHSRHPEHAWLIVDPDMSGRAFMRYDMHDTTGDGYIDRWELDVTGDGTPDDVWTCGLAESPRVFAYTFENIHRETVRSLESMEFLQWMERVASTAVRHLPANQRPQRIGVEQIFFRSLPGQSPEVQRQLRESKRYYQYAVQSSIDYHLAHLRMGLPGYDMWRDFDAARSVGDLERMITVLSERFDIEQSSVPAILWPPLNVGLMQKTVGWNDEWLPPNVGWESEKAGFRFYWGQIDIFGKNRDILISPTLGTENYHVEQEWGMDTLLVGETAGAGGIALQVDGEYIPIRTPAGEGDIVFEHELLIEEDHQLGIRIMASNIMVDGEEIKIQMDFHAIGGKAYSPAAITLLQGPDDREMELLVEIVALKSEHLHVDEANALLGNWGQQAIDIGQIGLGISMQDVDGATYQEVEDAHALRVPIRVGETVHYRIHADWLNGHRFSRSPSSRNWFEKLQAEAGEILPPILTRTP